MIRPGIVHRIDKDTSGLLIVAKNDAAHGTLAEQIKNHSFTRIYNAVVYGGFSTDEGTVDAPIGRSQNDRKKMCVTDRNARGAVTHYRVLERLGRFTWLKLCLETGRTHQIRVHFSHIGHPLAGDDMYGGHLNGIGRQALCCSKVLFVHPVTGHRIELACPPQDDMMALVQ